MASCNCHGKRGVATTSVSPYDQCTACARKHIVKAWTLWSEFTYLDDNRDFITGHLRAAVDHLMYEHRAIALQARDLAMALEENRDVELDMEWPELLIAVREAFYADHPDAKKRLEDLKNG